MVWFHCSLAKFSNWESHKKKIQLGIKKLSTGIHKKIPKMKFSGKLWMNELSSVNDHQLIILIIIE